MVKDPKLVLEINVKSFDRDRQEYVKRRKATRFAVKPMWRQ
jgi:hypothetical protein